MYMTWTFDFDSKEAIDSTGHRFKYKEKSIESVDEEVKFLMNSGCLTSHFLCVRTYLFHNGRGLIVYTSNGGTLDGESYSLFQQDEHGLFHFSKSCKKYIWKIICFILHMNKRKSVHRKISLKLDCIHLDGPDHVLVGEVDELDPRMMEHTYVDDFSYFLDDLKDRFINAHHSVVFHEEVLDFVATASSILNEMRAMPNYSIFHVHPAIWLTKKVRTFILEFDIFLTYDNDANTIIDKVDESFLMLNCGEYKDWQMKVDAEILVEHTNTDSGDPESYPPTFKGFVKCICNCYFNFPHYQPFKHKENVHVYFQKIWPNYVLGLWKMLTLMQCKEKVLNRLIE
ncbi:hypothetical protein AXF42_Ash006189 [Apostasia shenzhenica]|uniref:Uncharacterized protein n=1 Tax=Apostasia shenzhenica TaxID=1088818 RepID=A0A2I0B0G3_9ASPA|nr:hypothetical protein AXF42_Ash006189 [Apostasia shenzhenica]